MGVEKIKVSLLGVLMHGYHGYFPQERIVGNEFKINLDVIYQAPSKIDDDSLDSLISYADLYEIVSEEMKKPRKLLETVCRDILNQIRKNWAQTERIVITIEKLNPPISHMSGQAAVTIEYDNNF